MEGVCGASPRNEAFAAADKIERRGPRRAFCARSGPGSTDPRGRDALELQLSADRWPLPKYREMLFLM